MAICGTWSGRHQRPNFSCINSVRSHQFPRSVVLLAKSLAPTVEVAVAAVGAPKALVGIIIAAMVLLPEGIAACQAARANRLQTSLNLALGSALASIGLTIPPVAIVSPMAG